MPQIVILGSCKHEPYVVLISPHKLDAELYQADHEAAYVEATKKFYPLIEECDEVWVYAPNGIGGHTQQDIDFAKKQGKPVLILMPMDHWLRYWRERTLEPEGT